MSRRTKQPAASRRTRRAEQPQPVLGEFGFAETRRVVSNPIFYCGEDGGASESKPRGDQLGCVVYGPGAVAPASTAGATQAAGSSGVSKPLPLPLPPCRAHRAARVGPACVVVGGGTQGSRGVSRRSHHHYQHQHDPFLAAYVACSKSSSGARAKRQHGEKKKTTTGRRRNGDKGDDVVVRRCGVWNGWAAGGKCVAAMSCKNGCAVNNVRARDVPSVLTAKEEEPEAEALTLDLSWAPVVLSARAREWRREQR